MYQIMVGPGIGIRGFDPINPSGASGINWGTSTSDTNILKVLTESATNLRYRDDYHMMSSNVLYGVGAGLALVPGTYHVFGVNGTTAYNGTVNSVGNTSLNNLNTNGVGITAAQLRQYLTTATRSPAGCGRLHHSVSRHLSGGQLYRYPDQWHRSRST